MSIHRQILCRQGLGGTRTKPIIEAAEDLEEWERTIAAEIARIPARHALTDYGTLTPKSQ